MSERTAVISRVDEARVGASPRPASDGRRLKVAYLMSRFPKLTETFVLYEILAVERQGVEVEIYPLLRERTTIMHPEAVALVQRAHFIPFISADILRAHMHFLARKPRAYAGALAALLRGNWGSRRYFLGALGLFPKAVAFAAQIEAAGITHVHAHFASHPAAAAFVIHRLTGIPFSFTAHGSDLHRDRHMLREKVAEAAFVVAISEFNRGIILETCGESVRDKVTVIHCGVDTTLFEPSAAAGANGRADGAFHILCTGTLHEVKGQRYLIEACRLLTARGIDVVCHFAGDGPDLDALRRQAEQAGLSERVRFHGRLTRQEIIALLRQVHALAAPSVPSSDGRREGIPVALIEAMASGLPVVASRLSGIPELVQDQQTGLLVEPGDAEGLADALQRLHADPALAQQLGRAARSKVLREFDLATNAATLIKHFREGARR